MRVPAAESGRGFGGSGLSYRWPETAGPDSFDEASAELDNVSPRLRDAITKSDRHAFDAAAFDALAWGRVAGSVGKLDAFWEALPDSLRRLEPATADRRDLAGIPMNSSWTKLYHLLLDGMPM